MPRARRPALCVSVGFPIRRLGDMVRGTAAFRRTPVDRSLLSAMGGYICSLNAVARSCSDAADFSDDQLLGAVTLAIKGEFEELFCT